MYETLVYTLVNDNIEELEHRKQQKSQKLVLFRSTLTHTVSVMRTISPIVIFAVFDMRVFRCCR